MEKIAFDSKEGKEQRFCDLFSMRKELSMVIGDRVFFEKNSYSIRSEDVQTLSRLGTWLKENDCGLLIEGHTDEIGTRNYSLALGYRRAYTILDYFISMGIEESRVRIISYGKEVPAILGDDEYSWSKNRRAVFVLEQKR
ncbi:OmpA family protein [Liberibacter sp. Z1]|nr:OmpA family protein [Candidatus Liberibacter sp.]